LDRYSFHEGYRGRHVGYYGGVNYGFGYGGIGFSGGEWRGNSFAYNTAVMRVNATHVHTTYADRTVVERDTIANSKHVAYNGGPGGVQHAAYAEEQAAGREAHTAPTSFRTQHVAAARVDKSSYAKANGGHPANLVAARPLAAANHAAPVAQQESRPAAQQQLHPAPQQQSRPGVKQQSRPAVQQESCPVPQQYVARISGAQAGRVQTVKNISLAEDPGRARAGMAKVFHFMQLLAILGVLSHI
jgi:hypothetical protein